MAALNCTELGHGPAQRLGISSTSRRTRDLPAHCDMWAMVLQGVWHVMPSRMPSETSWNLVQRKSGYFWERVAIKECTSALGFNISAWDRMTMRFSECFFFLITINCVNVNYAWLKEYYIIYIYLSKKYWIFARNSTWCTFARKPHRAL